MALISCPECGKQISDTTPSCPHCGYILSTGVNTVPVPVPTKIEESNDTYESGVGFVAVGVICLVASIFLCIFTFVLGLPALLVSIVIISSGRSRMKGVLKVHCPFCGKSGKLEKTMDGYKCPTCKKRSVRDGEYLKPVI